MAVSRRDVVGAEVDEVEGQPGNVMDDIDRVLPASAGADVDSASRRLPEDLQDALLELPAEFRAAVVLSDVVGLAYQDVADALSVPVGTVRSRIHRGRSRLREILA